ncbi:MAG: sigma-54-dependent Fis family transcriptional regulator, partial [Leptospiraceae bacterium]|nr:sigma-54-dependent Fis family transcriptional regulator [Leptospiraceae bacterium]
KLLRVLQEMTMERVGSSQSLQVDVRVLATTNRNLQQYVSDGEFRQDLYYRLAVVPLEIPPLRARRDDVPELAQHFLSKVAQRLGRDACELSAEATNLLCEYHWPGNVRELENLMTRVSVMAVGDCIETSELQPWLLGEETMVSANTVAANSPEAAAAPLAASGASLQDMERKLIESTLEKYDGHRGNTAQALGIGVRTLA